MTAKRSAVLVNKKSGFGDLEIRRNERNEFVVTGPNHTDEYIIMILRINEECKINGSPSVRLFRRPAYGRPNQKRAVVDVTDTAHSDEKLVEIVEDKVCG